MAGTWGPLKSVNSVIERMHVNYGHMHVFQRDKGPHMPNTH